MIKSVNKDFRIILIGKLLQAIIAVLSIRVTTSLFDPEQMGNIYIFMTIYTFFVLSLISPFGQYINRKTHAWHANQSIMNHLSIYVIYILSVSLLSIFVGYLLYGQGISNGIDLQYLLPLMAGFILLFTLHQTIIPMLNMLYFRLSFTVLMVLTAVGVLTFGYLFVILFGAKSQYWLVGMLLSNLLFLTIGFYMLKNRLNEQYDGFVYNIKKINKEKLTEVLKFAIPLSAATLFMWLQNSGYKIIIEREIGLEFLGFLGVGMAVSSQIASIFESIVMQYFHPIYYKQITNANIQERKIAINNLINTVLPIYFMLTLFISFLAKYLVEILVDEKYHDVYIFTIFGIWIEFFRMTANLFGNISQSEMNTKKFMFPYVIGSLITVFLVYFISTGNEYKLYLPIVLVVGGMITMFMMYVSMQKLIKFNINYGLIGTSLILSIPYLGLLIFTQESSLLSSLFIVFGYGLYFLGIIYIIHKKSMVIR